MITLIGKKIGMTSIFVDKYFFIPVTIVKIDNNIITCIKKYKNKYSTQLTTGVGNKKNINKCLLGIYKKLNINPGIGL